jgi:hypothetical protein
MTPLVAEVLHRAKTLELALGIILEDAGSVATELGVDLAHFAGGATLDVADCIFHGREVTRRGL